MVYVIVSEYSRRIAHQLDDGLERWKLRRESSVHFNDTKSSVPFDELDKKYKSVIEAIRCATSIKDLYDAKREARNNLKLADEKREALKIRIKLSKNKSEASKFILLRKAMKLELAYCHDIIAQINRMIKDVEVT